MSISSSPSFTTGFSETFWPRLRWVDHQHPRTKLFRGQGNGQDVIGAVVEDRQLGLEIAVPLTVVIVSAPRGEILRATFLPHLELNFAFIFIITGVLGTTISPYMFFWEASEEVEEEEAHHLIGTDGKPRIGRAYLTSLRLDNLIGMVFSETATWAIIVVAATVLHANGVTNVATAADAARALDPLARKLREAHGFYGVITIATLLGLAINFVGIDPIQALIYTAVINGVVAVPLLFLIARIAERRDIMGEFASGWLSRARVWLTFIAMGAAARAMFGTLGRS